MHELVKLAYVLELNYAGLVKISLAVWSRLDWRYVRAIYLITKITRKKEGGGDERAGRRTHVLHTIVIRPSITGPEEDEDFFSSERLTTYFFMTNRYGCVLIISKNIKISIGRRNKYIDPHAGHVSVVFDFTSFQNQGSRVPPGGNPNSNHGEKNREKGELSISKILKNETH